jgi:hypothetical protein
VMKNWLPLVSGPALAMLSTPALSCFMVKFSSLKVRPYIDSPPVPGPARGSVLIVKGMGRQTALFLDAVMQDTSLVTW